MATNESWVLDGVSISSGNFDILELNADPPKSRAEWLSSADSEGATLMRQPLYENRTITMRLRVAAQASMNAALDQIGVIRDKLLEASGTPDGVTLVWTPANSTRSVTFDVVAGEIPEMPIGLSDQAWSWFKQRPIISVEMTCKPFWRGTETLTSTASSSTPFVTIEVAGVTGDAPALGRLILTDTATQNRRHAEWGLENQNYNSGLSLLIDSDSLVTTGFAGAGNTRTGAYDPNAAGNNVIRASLYSGVSVFSGAPTGVQAVCGTGVQSHIGTFLVRARVYSTTTDANVRFSWQVGDGPFLSNSYDSPIIANGFSDLNLGQISIPAVTSGTQRWVGRVEASGTIGETLDVDYLILIPVAEGYGIARATYAYSPGSVVGRDEFTGTTATSALNARVAPAGGTWTTSGSTGDFLFVDGPGSNAESVTRISISDSGTGRYAILGSTNYTDTEVQAHLLRTAQFDPSQVRKLGVIARYVDSSNYLIAYLALGLNSGNWEQLYVDKVIAGTATRLGTVPQFVQLLKDNFFSIRLLAYASGWWTATLLDQQGNVLRATSGVDSAVATGGTLATGKPGLLDYSPGTTVVNRYYDYFVVATPMLEPITVYSGRNMQFRFDDTVRQDSTGTYAGRPPSYKGSRFLLPPGTSRVLVKARRTDVEVDADAAVTDATQIQVGWTPRGLVVPR